MKMKNTHLLTRLHRKRNKAGFTLVELLVVVAILAIIAGGLVASYDGFTRQATKSQAARDIAALNNLIRQHRITENQLPNNVESLLQAVPVAPAVDAISGDIVAPTVTGGAVVTATATNPFIEAGLQGKFAAGNLTAAQISNLVAAGITRVRHLDSAGTDEVASDLVTLNAEGGAAVNVGVLSTIDIPTQAFSAPRTGANRNRGRGFSSPITADPLITIPANTPFAIWGGQTPATPVVKYDNIKVGASPTAVLVMFGLGPDSSIVKAARRTDGVVAQGDARAAGAPVYADVARNQYGNYIMLVDVAQHPAKMVGVVDSKGDFLAEEIAEASGQKL